MPGDPRAGRGPAQSPQASRSLQEDPLGPRAGRGPAQSPQASRGVGTRPAVLGRAAGPAGSPRHPRAEGLDVRVQAGGGQAVSSVKPRFKA